ncbi:MAG: TIGR04283 family arsenosugar biosynthesis glycosyltransferase [Thermoleophilaceae bacterium]|nr:TIGR04283 family arsenosugar biosynthesis glycosyltransferase [Thermoleophilaceae bacterium]
MTTAPLISIVVPVLDEAAALPALLDRLGRLAGRWELVVCDGGSSDATPDIARSHAARPTVVCASRGRATQMNAGSAAARGDALLFLHADTQLPAGAHAQLTRALADPAVLGGNFALRFDGRDRFSRVLGVWYAVQRRARVYYGDSAIWLRRDIFDRLDGYRPLAIMEDYDLVRRLERTGRTTCLPGPVITSARRWRRLGLVRTISCWLLIRWLFVAGASPARLARLYPNVR